MLGDLLQTCTSAIEILMAEEGVSGGETEHISEQTTEAIILQILMAEESGSGGGTDSISEQATEILMVEDGGSGSKTDHFSKQETEIVTANEAGSSGGTARKSEEATEILMDEEGGSGGGTDRISDLPNSILHSIMLQLPGGTAEAVRTSVLAKRWRYIWAHLPELSFRGDCRVETAQAAYLAPTIKRLKVDMLTSSYSPHRIFADRVSSWLHLASKRLAGELSIRVSRYSERRREVVLPVCEMATTINMELRAYTLRFALQPTDMFSALAILRIQSAYVDARELQGLLAHHCPRLKQLILDTITLLDGARALSIHSNSLQQLEIDTEYNAKVEIVAPELQAFYPHYQSQFDIPASPKLSDVDWSSSYLYNPQLHSFGVAGRHIQRLVL
ncbi:hypothetical protein EJB05_57599, partial [Eragrostis curvula]